MLAVAAAAKFRHPAVAAISVERLSLVPDLGETPVADIVEHERRNGFRRVAGQNLAGRRDIDPRPSPAAHTGFRVGRVVVGADIIDDDNAFEALAGLFDKGVRLQKLLAGRHECGAVLVRPAMKLHRGDLDAAGAKPDGEIEHVADLVHVLLVADGIDGQRNAGRMGPFGNRDLAVITAFIAADLVGKGRRGPLNGKLQVVEPRVGKLGDPLFGEADARGDEVRIKSGRCGRGGQFHEIAPRGRLTARQMQMENAHGRSLLENVDPFGRRKLGLDGFKLERVGAIGAGQRATMRQFRQHGDRGRHADRLPLPFHRLPDRYVFVQDFSSSMRRLENSSTNEITSTRI